MSIGVTFQRPSSLQVVSKAQRKLNRDESNFLRRHIKPGMPWGSVQSMIDQFAGQTPSPSSEPMSQSLALPQTSTGSDALTEEANRISQELYRQAFSMMDGNGTITTEMKRTSETFDIIERVIDGDDRSTKRSSKILDKVLITVHMTPFEGNEIILSEKISSESDVIDTESITHTYENVLPPEPIYENIPFSAPTYENDDITDAPVHPVSNPLYGLPNNETPERRAARNFVYKLAPRITSLSPIAEEPGYLLPNSKKTDDNNNIDMVDLNNASNALPSPSSSSALDASSPDVTDAPVQKTPATQQKKKAKLSRKDAFKRIFKSLPKIVPVSKDVLEAWTTLY